MKTKLDHIGIAVKDLDTAVKTFTIDLGLPEALKREIVEDQGVEVAFVEAGGAGAGAGAGAVTGAGTGAGCKIEFLQPIKDDSPIAKFLERKGEGIHHICLEVVDLKKTLATLESRGVPLVDHRPRTGAHGKRIAFLHPKATAGVLVELCEKIG